MAKPHKIKPLQEVWLEVWRYMPKLLLFLFKFMDSMLVLAYALACWWKMKVMAIVIFFSVWSSKD